MSERPTIKLRVNHRIPAESIQFILLGMEEEGIPSEVARHDDLNPLDLAHEASLESRLGVGIGVSLDWVVITTDKLPAERPYLVGNLNASPDEDRVAGTNAARLVKRVPLQVAAPVKEKS
ncbi:MAG: glycerol dehydratase reactivase beta/small subunit family protein [Arachnia sp.]